jgi:hypothetical protein
MTAEQRTSVLRKPTPDEQLAKLHPIERAALRVFEFLASIKLALFVMTWLAIECIIGAQLESKVNTPAARYLVYGNTRFVLCLALLATNILCAALIRFPWKRYQTGFVITHIGLLALLFGSMLTLRDHLDCLMVVSKVENQSPDKRWERTIFDSDREEIEVSTIDMKTGKASDPERVDVDLGPFTWGDKLFGFIPWRDGYQEIHRLRNGDELRIKQFYAKAEAEPTYIPSEKDVPGIPAALVRLAIRDSEDRSPMWLEFDKERHDQKLNFGVITTWATESAEEWEHAWRPLAKLIESKGRESSDDGGLLGWLNVEIAGKRHRFKVEDLRRGKTVAIPGSSDAVQVLDYLPDAKPGANPGELVQGADAPNNPSLKVRVVVGGKSKDVFCASDRKRNAELAKAYPANVRLAYTPSASLRPDLGALLVTYRGEHYAVPVSDLRDEPLRLKDGEGETEVELAEYYACAEVNETRTGLTSKGDDPTNPALKLKIKHAGKADDAFCFANPELNEQVRRKNGLYLSYFVAGKRPTMQLVLGPDRQIAYAAWSSQGLFAAQAAEIDKPMPSWFIPRAGTSLELTVSRLLPNARPDVKLTPKPPEPREKGDRAVVVELHTRDGNVTTSLHRLASTAGERNQIRIGNRVLQLRLTYWEMTVPFGIRLDDFREPKIPGTQDAANFTSIVTLKDPKQRIEERRVITMNQPLRHEVSMKREGWLGAIFPTTTRTYTLYQTNIFHSPQGPISTFTVAYDPGSLWKNFAGFTIAIGIFLMFYMGGYFRASKKKKTPFAQPRTYYGVAAPVDAEAVLSENKPS